VQGEIDRVVREISGRSDHEIYGAGRTDAGVHALGQVAHLDVNTNLTPGRLVYALNDALPADINVLSAEKVARQFHARHAAKARSYVYQISRRRTAFAKPFVWWIKDPLDAGRMREAAALFGGMNDFRSFTDDDPGQTSTRVLIERVDLQEHDELLVLRVLGSHFLWKMVRRMVGVLAEVGSGGLKVADVKRFLNEHHDDPAALTAPPSGLFLERVYYDDDAAARGAAPPAPIMALGLRV
jgi:tRNA pseudouridine38-40 synthase